MRFYQILVLILFLLLNVFACARSLKMPAQTKVIIQEKVADHIVSLQEQAKKCLLYVGEHQLQLQIPWPCDFHRNLKNEVRIKSLDNSKIFLIEASAPHPILTDSCDTRVQAVKISKQTVVVSEYVNEVAICLPFQWDAKIFTALFK